MTTWSCGPTYVLRLTWQVTQSVWHSCVFPHRNSPAGDQCKHSDICQKRQTPLEGCSKPCRNTHANLGLTIDLCDCTCLEATCMQKHSLRRAIYAVHSVVAQHHWHVAEGSLQARAPSKMESSSLQPVVMLMTSPLCSWITAAVVNPMGMTFQAASGTRVRTELSRSNAAVKGVQQVTFGLQLCHLGFAQALYGAQLLLCGVCEVVHGVDATLLEFLYICSRDAKLLQRQARPWSQTIVSAYQKGHASRMSQCPPEAALLGTGQRFPRPPAAPAAAPHVPPAAPCRLR